LFYGLFYVSHHHHHHQPNAAAAGGGGGDDDGYLACWLNQLQHVCHSANGDCLWQAVVRIMNLSARRHRSCSIGSQQWSADLGDIVFRHFDSRIQWSAVRK